MMTNAEAMDFAKTLTQDQTEWLDAEMKKLLPPVLHDKFVRGDFSGEAMGAWLRRNEIQIIPFSNVPVLRLVQKGRIISEFKPRITIEGREVDIWKVINSDNTNPNDIWADSDAKTGT